ncbi:MAG: hypothetical protein ACE14W_11585, partial [Candidatus Velamenicoccus archaeovorus]
GGQDRERGDEMSGTDGPVRFVNPPDLPAPMGSTHVVEATEGRMVFVSGQVAMDASRGIVGIRWSSG